MHYVCWFSHSEVDRRSDAVLLMLWLGVQANPAFCHRTQLDHDCRLSVNPSSQGKKKMKNQKLNQLRQTIGRCAVALLIPVCLIVTVMTASPAQAKVAITIVTIGTSGTYDGTCSVASCNDADGCRTWVNVKDLYFPRTQCSGPLNGSGAGACDGTVARHCRDIETYDNSAPNCHGILTAREIQNKYSCG